MKCKSDMQKRKQDCLLMKARISLPLMAGSLLLFCFSNRSYSQGNISMEQVDIVKAYQPLLADAEKIIFKAEPVVADSSITELKYDVKPHLISVPFVPAGRAWCSRESIATWRRASRPRPPALLPVEPE